MPEDPKENRPPAAQPITIIDLLRALERSRDLRGLARECGLTVKELRRRLASWSREMEAETSRADGEPGQATKAPRKRAAVREWPELTPASQIRTNPLPRRGNRVLEAYTDGASRGNPGPAAIGIVFRQKGGEDLCTHAEAIGRATNNEAEYHAVIRALEFCRSWRVRRLDLYLDSELIARQLNGEYRVKSLTLRPLYQRAAFLARDLQSFQVRHVPRERNRHADRLAGSAISQRRTPPR